MKWDCITLLDTYLEKMRRSALRRITVITMRLLEVPFFKCLMVLRLCYWPRISSLEHSLDSDIKPQLIYKRKRADGKAHSVFPCLPVLVFCSYFWGVG